MRERRKQERGAFVFIFFSGRTSCCAPPALSLSPSLSSAAAAGLITPTAAWSHSSASAATALAGSLAADGAADVAAHTGEAGLAAILADPATEAVLVVLPVQAMPGVVTRALGAGKHVLQEKPVAPTVAEATAVAAAAAAAALAAAGGGAAAQPLWCLAENYRSEPGVLAAAAAAAPASLGPAVLVSLVANMPMDAGNRYHGSAWRRDTATCPGGFLMDSTVHFLAALRAATGAGGAGWGEPVTASAVAYGADGEDAAADGPGDGGAPAADAPPPLPSPDTLAGCLTFGNGRAASLSITFAGSLPHLRLAVEGRRGAVALSRGGFPAPAAAGGEGKAPPPVSRGGGYDLATATRTPGAGLATAHAFHPFAGLDRELAAFVRLVRGGRDAADAAALSPAAAARDLAAIEALLAAAAAGGAPVPVSPLPANPWDALEAAGGVP